MASMKWLGYVGAVCLGAVITLAVVSVVHSPEREQPGEVVRVDEPSPAAEPLSASTAISDVPAPEAAAEITTNRGSPAGQAQDLRALLEAGDIQGLMAVVSEGPFESRLIAANYLAVLGDPNAIPAIEAASRAFTGPEWANPFAEPLATLMDMRDRLTPGAARRPRNYRPSNVPQLIVVKVQDAVTQEPIADVNVVASTRDNSGKTVIVYTGKTDAAGTCRITSDAGDRSLEIEASRKGYVGGIQHCWVSAVRRSAGPTVMALVKAVTVGGIVTTREGEPLSGVTVEVRPSMTMRGLYSGTERLAGRAETDEDGRWVCENAVPEDSTYAQISLEHPLYVQDSSGEIHASVMALLRNRSLPMTVVKGVSLAGVVKDPYGRDLAGATVSVESYQPGNQARHAVSDSAGAFRLPLCRPGSISLKASAKGYIDNTISVVTDTDVSDIEIGVVPPHVLSGRVMDTDGNPIADVNVWQIRNQLDIWPGEWKTVTDGAGRFMWDAAPPRESLLFFCKSGFMSVSRTVSPGDEELTAVLQKTILVSGNVINSSTGEPVKAFQIELQTAVGNTSFSEYARRGENFADGLYSLALEREGEQYRIKAHAEGYVESDFTLLPEPQDGLISCDISLRPLSVTPAGAIKGTVYLSDGSPAGGAMVVAVQVGRLAAFEDGKLVEGTNPSVPSAVADAQGMFELSGVTSPYLLIATHEKGFASEPGEAFASRARLDMVEYARIRGQVTANGRPAANLVVGSTRSESSAGMPDLTTFLGWYWRQTSVTDAEGKFVFDKVPPGRHSVAIANSDGNGSRYSKTVTVAAGETADISMGNKGGRPVTAKLERPEGLAADILWSNARAYLDSAGNFDCVVAADTAAQKVAFPWPTDIAQMTFSETIGWHRIWSESAEGQAYRKELAAARKALLAGHKAVQTDCALDGAGSLSGMDIAPGEYMLKVLFRHEANGQAGRHAGIGTCTVTIPQAEAGSEGTAVDLGTLQLDMVYMEPGHPMPPLKMISPDGRDVDLNDFRGRYLFVTLWVSMFNINNNQYSKDYVEQASSAAKRFSSDQRIAIVNATDFIRQPELTLFFKFLAQKGLTNPFIVPADRQNMRTTEVMRLGGSPCSVLVSPEGQIIFARDMYTENAGSLEAAIAAALDGDVPAGSPGR